MWGDAKSEAVLVFHGIMDNAGSFDNLIPLLPQCFYYICIDLPGHGRSSHLPPFLPIHTTDHLLVYRMIVEYFNRVKYLIMGHSYGGQIGILFAQLYPKYVSGLILLDTFYFYPFAPKFFMHKLVESHNLLLKLQKQAKEDKPIYTYEEALNKLMNNRNYGTLDRKSAEPLLKRMIQSVGDDKYVFTIDQRLKSFQNPSGNIAYIIDLLLERPVRCPVLVIVGSESKAQAVYFKPLMKYFKKHKIIIKVVDGDHNVHNTFAERVAPTVIKFLLKIQHKLYTVVLFNDLQHRIILAFPYYIIDITVLEKCNLITG